MKERDKLYNEAKLLLENSNVFTESILYHNIYSLKMSGNYLYTSKNDVLELVDFLNSFEN